MTVPVFSFQYPLELCRSFDPRTLYLSVVTIPGQAGPKVVVGHHTYCGAIWKLQTGDGREESFLSHILVSTSSFVGDDEVLTKSSRAGTDVVIFIAGPMRGLFYKCFSKCLFVASLVCSDLINNQTCSSTGCGGSVPLT